MTSYLRYPDVFGDELVFCCDDDVWLASLNGGLATRITNDHQPVRTPRFSPDGRKIAWIATLDGAPEVYVIDRATGEVQRRTWWSDSTTRVLGWDGDRVLVATAAGQRNKRLAYVYSVDDRGDVEHLPLGLVRSMAMRANGDVATTTTVGLEGAHWKRYRGGEAPALWLRRGDDWTRLLPDQAAGIYSVGWFGDRLFFASDLGAGGLTIEDPSAQSQLWSVNPQGEDLRQHTFHDESVGYVRDPMTDGETIVFHSRGRLYAMAGLDAEATQIDVEIPLGAPRPVRPSPTDRLESIMPDHDATGSVIEWRGAAYYLTHRAGPARALCDRAGVRVSLPSPLGDTGKVVMVSDAEQEHALVIANLDAEGEPRVLCSGELGEVLALAASPSGELVAIGSHDGRVHVVLVADGERIEVGRSPQGEVSGFAWSPDSRYLVWREALGNEGERGRLACWDARERHTTRLTCGKFNNFSAAFTDDGKHLCFLSSRTFDPHYDQFGFDLSFSDSVRPWLVPLKRDDVAPFGPSADGWPLVDKDDKKDHDQDAKEQAGDARPPASVLEPDGFEERMVPFPTPSGTYLRLSSVKDGVVWQRQLDVPGELGLGRVGTEAEPSSTVLEYFSFPQRKVDLVVARLDSFEVSGNGESIVVRNRDEVSVQPADRKIDDDDDAARVRVDLGRLRRDIHPRDEWRQMFNENGRIMRDHFWREDMNGVDWDAVLARYRPLIDQAMTYCDVYDILLESVAELNTSHSYVIAPDADDLDARVGFLGADLSRTPDGEWRLERIVPGETSDPRAWSPLRQAGVAAQAGDVITAIDGHPTRDARHIGELLTGTAGRVTELTLRSGDVTRRVAVVPLASEQTLRYHDWVASRRAYVEAHADGRIGYLHVPDMVANGWAQFARQIDDAVSHEAVIVDVRCNGGGHTSQLVLERLARRVVGFDVARHYDEPAPYPSQGLRGPVVFVTNQFAGSDGDVVTAVAQAMNLGTVVGERSWGGVIGIDSRFDLVDGTTVTQPRYSFWLQGKEWGVENHGVDPDVEVALSPADWESDDDLQLDVAIEVTLRQLAQRPATTPPKLPAPLFTPKGTSA